MKNKIFLICFVIYGFSNIFNLTTMANSFFNNDKKNEYIKSSDNVELAKVKQIIDGDTIHIYTGGEIIKSRLIGIDCMETLKIHRAYRQAYENKLSIEEIIKQGKYATKELKNIIKANGNYVYFKSMGVDKYNRLLVILYDNNKENINEKLLKSGYCPAYTYKKN